MPGGGSGGARPAPPQRAPCAARAAVVIGAHGIETYGVETYGVATYGDPDRAPSDGPNMVPLAQMDARVASLMAFDRLAKAAPLRV